MLSQTRENSCHWLSHGDYTWRTPVLAGLKSSSLTETRCYPLVAQPTEVVSVKVLVPLVLVDKTTTDVRFPLSDSGFSSPVCPLACSSTCKLNKEAALSKWAFSSVCVCVCVCAQSFSQHRGVVSESWLITNASYQRLNSDSSETSTAENTRQSLVGDLTQGEKSGWMQNIMDIWFLLRAWQCAICVPLHTACV